MSTTSVDALASLETEVAEHFFESHPTQAAGLGLHEYDGKLPDLSAEATQAWSRTAQTLLRRLDELGGRDLPSGRQLDRDLLRLLLDGSLFELNESRDLDRNPMSYLFVPDLTNYIARDYAPIDVRAGAVRQILAAVPHLLDTARHRLEAVLPKPFVTLAIQIASGLPEHFAEGETLAAAAPSELRSSVREARSAADDAARSFGQWLQQDRLPRASEDFRLGRERFQRLLWVREGLRTPVEDILAAGRADLQRNQDRLTEIGRQTGTPPATLLARLNERHPTEAELLPLVRRLTDEAREFVRTRDLATIPEPELCHVRETPPWARDLWTAALSPPGPFEKPIDGIYWVTTVDPAWSAAQRDGWMRTLNSAMLKNTTVHEVWPGHYLQALHFRRTEQSLARKVWFSFSFCEGWAHYCEQASVEAGYDGRSVDAEVAELRDALLRDCRLIASISMHTQGMTVEEATRMMQAEAHLEEIHAQREAIRGTYNPEYFCYTLGKLAILDVRAKYLATRYGSSLRRFHDSLLSFGTPPIGFLDGLVANASAH